MNAPAPTSAPAANAEPVFAAQRRTTLVAIHCSATPDDRTLFYGSGRELRTPVDEIDTWHWDRGFRRQSPAVQAFNPHLRAVGYHFVIARNGAVFTGRHPNEVPAHAKGHNTGALAICMVGIQRYTPAQWAQLAELVSELCDANRVPLQPVTPARLVGVAGHRDLSPDLDRNGKITRNEWVKTCPGFDVATWLAGGMQPLAEHTAPEVGK